MLMLAFDFAVLLAALSFFTDEDWSENIKRLLAITVVIGVLGSVGTYNLARYTHWSIGLLVYFVFGVIILAGVAKTSTKHALTIMGIFVVYRCIFKGVCFLLL